MQKSRECFFPCADQDRAPSLSQDQLQGLRGNAEHRTMHVQHFIFELLQALLKIYSLFN